MHECDKTRVNTAIAMKDALFALIGEQRRSGHSSGIKQHSRNSATSVLMGGHVTNVTDAVNYHGHSQR